jgi:hypothetical protein
MRLKFGSASTSSNRASAVHSDPLRARGKVSRLLSHRGELPLRVRNGHLNQVVHGLGLQCIPRELENRVYILLCGRYKLQLILPETSHRCCGQPLPLYAWPPVRFPQTANRPACSSFFLSFLQGWPLALMP